MGLIFVKSLPARLRMRFLVDSCSAVGVAMNDSSLGYSVLHATTVKKGVTPFGTFV